MLNDLAVHVRNVESSFRPLGQIHRSEPVVTGGEQFATSESRRSREGRTLRGEPIGMNQITRGVAGKDSVGAFRSQQRLALPDLDAAGGAERTGMPIGGGDIRTDRKKPDAVMSAVDAVEGVALIAILHGFTERQAWIPLQPLGIEDDMLDRYAVHADETVAEVIKAHPILRLPVD